MSGFAESSERVRVDGESEVVLDLDESGPRRPDVRWRTSPCGVTGLVPSARYHERMNATGRTDHHVDPDLDAEQLLGLMPPISAKRLAVRVKRQRDYRPDHLPDDPPSVGQ